MGAVTCEPCAPTAAAAAADPAAMLRRSADVAADPAALLWAASGPVLVRAPLALPVITTRISHEGEGEGSLCAFRAAASWHR